MRRFLLLSVLAVIVGLGLAGVGYWAVWAVLTPRNVSAVSRPDAVTGHSARTEDVVVLDNAEEVQRLLDETSWISAGDGQGDPVWIIGDREALGQAATRIEALKPGTALRIIPFAPADQNGVSQASGPDRATVAELWLSRDWLLYGRWLATEPDKWTAAGIPPADQDTARSGLVDTGRRFVERLSALIRTQGLADGYPVVIWRNGNGAMKACACTTDRAWRDVDISADTPVAVIAEPTEKAPVQASGTGASGPSYPTVSASPAVVPVTPSTARTEVAVPPSRRAVERPSTPARQAPVRSDSERKTPRRLQRESDNAPRAERQADSMFY